MAKVEDEIILAYISPGDPVRRKYLVEWILNFVDTNHTDIVHLDQSTTLINDHNCDHSRGLVSSCRELKAKPPAEEAGLMRTLLVGKPDIYPESAETAAVFTAARAFT